MGYLLPIQIPRAIFCVLRNSHDENPRNATGTLRLGNPPQGWDIHRIAYDGVALGILIRRELLAIEQRSPPTLEPRRLRALADISSPALIITVSLSQGNVCARLRRLHRSLTNIK